MRSLPRLGVRSRLLVTVVGALAVALTAGVVAFNLLLGGRLSGSATSAAQARARAELSSLEVRNGRLVAPEGPDEGALQSQVWIFADGRTLESPNLGADLDRAAAALAGGPEQAASLGERTRFYAVPVVQGGRRYGTVVAAVSLEPYEETGRTALTGSIALAVALLVAVTALTRWILGRALAPVARMTESAETWSAHDLDRRFGLGEPYDELTRLAATLDALLERLAASMRREQRFTAELSHELRTPLARVSAEAELALRREHTEAEYRKSIEAIHRSAEQMTRTVETLVAAARLEARSTRSTSDAREAVHAAVAAARDEGCERGPELRLSLPPEPVRVAADAELLQRMIKPLLDNAARYGRRTVEAELVRNGTSALIHIVDDGPGVRDDEQGRIFEPGARGSAANAADQGAGLGLALAQRLAQSAGGEISVDPSAAGGRFTVRLPLA